MHGSTTGHDPQMAKVETRESDMRQFHSIGFPVGRTSNGWRRTQKTKSKPKQKSECQICHIHLHQQSLQGFISSQPFHTVFVFLDPLLISIIQVKYQSMNESPFETHPATMWAFMVAIFIYCFAFQLSGLVALFAGSFSSVSLVSILLPHTYGHLVFIVMVVLPAIIAPELVQFGLKRVYKTSKITIVGIWNRFMGTKSMEQPQDSTENV